MTDLTYAEWRALEDAGCKEIARLVRSYAEPDHAKIALIGQALDKVEHQLVQIPEPEVSG